MGSREIFKSKKNMRRGFIAEYDIWEKKKIQEK